MSVVEALAAGGAVWSVVMIALWLIQKRTGDAGIVDVGWAAGVGTIAVAAAALVDGEPARRLLVGALTGLWSARLTLYILRDRVLKGDEDGRYQALRRSWGGRFEGRIFWFFQAQAALAVAFAVPPIVAMTTARGALDVLDGAAVLVWAVALIGETIADRQLERFRHDPRNRGRTCREGLWRYSRHPNYFFEWMHWWAYALAGFAATGWWITLAAPLVMLFFVLKVTGIPPTEARALESRGDDYRRYQQTTSAFVPWFPKSDADAAIDTNAAGSTS